VALWLLHCQGKPVAFEYHLEFQGVAYALRADFDESYRLLSPGAYLEQAIIRSLFDDAARRIGEYNTGADDYWYERRWTDKSRPHGKAWIFPRSVYGRVLRLLGLLRRPRRVGEHTHPMSCRAAS